ncbi:hypothetical protein H6P81_016109 [Aristolochia fimbriata]|uniref:Uncharacterized protein n=1 Tax=Aristolochia fimbriata TaxID=158543 RepID=A0AAV7E7R9_ARIFI|nr:hypothetical protein H6P81_016109 [Aristolochia fimbriata]
MDGCAPFGARPLEQDLLSGWAPCKVLGTLWLSVDETTAPEGLQIQAAGPVRQLDHQGLLRSNEQGGRGSTAQTRGVSRWPHNVLVTPRDYVEVGDGWGAQALP